MDTDGVETVDFNALGGTDTITVHDLAGTDVTNVDTRPRRHAGRGDGQADRVIVNGTAGNDAAHSRRRSRRRQRERPGRHGRPSARRAG